MQPIRGGLPTLEKLSKLREQPWKPDWSQSRCLCAARFQGHSYQGRAGVGRARSKVCQLEPWDTFCSQLYSNGTLIWNQQARQLQNKSKVLLGFLEISSKKSSKNIGRCSVYHLAHKGKKAMIFFLIWGDSTSLGGIWKCTGTCLVAPISVGSFRQQVGPRMLSVLHCTGKQHPTKRV